MEAVRSYETSVTLRHQFTRHIRENGSLQIITRDEETNIQATTIIILWN
jgi:hypothetical protein